MLAQAFRRAAYRNAHMSLPDDISDVLDLLGPRSVLDAGANGVLVPVHDELAAGEVESDMADMQLLLAGDGGHPVGKRYEHRSWALLEHARATKKVKRDEKIIADKDAALKETKAVIDAVTDVFPVVSASLGLKMRKPPMNENRAKLLMRLAMAPTVRSDTSSRNRQASAASLVTEAAHQTQAERWSKMCFAPLTDIVSSPDPLGRPTRTLALSLQFDESAQRAKAMKLLRQRLKGEHTSNAKVSFQVQVQGGAMFLSRDNLDGEGMTLLDGQPFLCKPVRLEGQKASDLLEGLRRRCPFSFDDPDFLSQAHVENDYIVFAITIDRASANLAMLRNVWKVITELTADETPYVFPHVELCSAHGVALVKKGSKHMPKRSRRPRTAWGVFCVSGKPRRIPGMCVRLDHRDFSSREGAHA